ncbi:hypothetical protein [Streptomyces sp. NPDC005181]|uniref:hypothetical protein n=1 Tax=Streptomyces sp. NPDC005181 TaxID=3156869 RepID=UPI0033A901A0
MDVVEEDLAVDVADRADDDDDPGVSGCLERVVQAGGCEAGPTGSAVGLQQDAEPP